jgi:transposase
MKTVEDYEQIRRAFFIEGQSIREIHRRLGVARKTIRKAIAEPTPKPYHLEQPRPAPVLGPYRERISELLEESEKLPRKQRYTARTICRIIRDEGYQGSEGGVHNYISRQRKERHRRKEAYLPLEFDAGQDAQVDWGEAAVKLAGKTEIVQFFSLRLNHSKARFVMAFPFQKQEALFEGHIQAFHFFGGVPRRITYDNLKTAVYKILEGKKRQEQQTFKEFRSYYLFESRFCTPTKAHEKGGVENDIGYAQRNFFSPIPDVASYQELNEYLLQACLQDAQRRTRGQKKMVEELWEEEKDILLPLPSRDYAACITRVVKPNGYLQVAYETNRYSVPYEYRDRQLVLRAFPFRIELLYLDEIAAVHQRSFEKEQDILDPLHYLPLLAQRPGAFEHAKPLRQWRLKWPESYDRLLQKLLEARPEGQGVKEFLQVLKLHQEYPNEEVERAVKTALELGAAHLDGVRLCLRQLSESEPQTWSLDLSFNPELEKIGAQPLDLGQYDRLVQVR